MRVVALVLVVALGCLGCSVPALDVTGKQCPCPSGWVCDEGNNTCVRTLPLDAPPAAMLVQQMTNAAGSGQTLAVTLAPVKAADTLVMIGAAVNSGLTSVTGGGATWTRAARSTAHSNVEIWYGVSDGTDATVAISLVPNNNAIWLSVSEWAGLATTNVLDAAHAANGTTVPDTAGTITTTHARDLMVFAVTDAKGSVISAPTPGTWSALEPITVDTAQYAWWTTTSATGAFTPTASDTGHGWDAVVAAFVLAP